MRGCRGLYRRVQMIASISHCRHSCWFCIDQTRGHSTWRGRGQLAQQAERSVAVSDVIFSHLIREEQADRRADRQAQSGADLFERGSGHRLRSSLGAAVIKNKNGVQDIQIVQQLIMMWRRTVEERGRGGRG